MPTFANYDDLLAGNTRYLSETYPEKRELFENLATGQSPHVTLVTCSDSRIDPCAITNTGAGDLFVVRNAGNIIPTRHPETSGEIATLEFAVRALGTSHIVVCGHSDCGAMKGLLAPEKCASLSYVPAWVRESEEALATIGSDLDPDTKLDRLIEANVLLQIEKLRSLEFIQAAEAAGTLQLHGWVFNIGGAAIKELAVGASETGAA